MAAVAEPKNLTEIIGLFTDIGLVLIPFLGAVAFLVFVLGVARFIKAAGNEKEIKDSKFTHLGNSWSFRYGYYLGHYNFS